MSFPTLPGMHGYPSAYPPGAFLDALRGSGWEPGTVPGSVIFTYARFELFLSAHPETYTPNHMLGPGPGRFFLVNATDGRVGVNCPGIGAPAAVAQLEVQAELGVERCVSIGTAGGFQADQEPGDVVLLTSAVRDEGTSYHYLPAGADAVPDPDLTARYGAALETAGLAYTTGATVTTDARPTAPRPRRFVTIAPAAPVRSRWKQPPCSPWDRCAGCPCARPWSSTPCPTGPGRPSAAMPPARARCSGGCSPRPSSSSPRLVNDRG